MATVTVYDRLNNRLMSGENLRPVLRYARKAPVKCVRIAHALARGHAGELAVTFYFDDGAECLTYWGDWRVLLTWIADRRSWGVEWIRLASTGPDIPHGDWRLQRLRDKGTQTLAFRT